MELLTLRVGDPGVVEVLARDDAPLGTYGDYDILVLHALKAGKTTLRLEGKFSDDSVRTATVEVEAREIDEVRVLAEYEGDRSIPVGERLVLDARMYGNGVELDGLVEDLLVGDDLNSAPRGGYQAFSVQPNAAVAVTLHSPYDSAFSFSVGVFDPSAVSEFRFVEDGVLWGTAGQLVRPKVRPVVDDPAACIGVPLEAASLTPDVCAVAANFDSIQLKSSGVCRVSLRAEESDHTSTPS